MKRFDDILGAIFKDSLAPSALNIKEGLDIFEGTLYETHCKKRIGSSVVRSYSAFVDDLLTRLFVSLRSKFSLNDNLALVALGGYGRGELNLRSDVDLMLLHSKKVSAGLKEFTEAMLYTLWDAGLDVGFSIRTVKDSLDLARTDLKTMTALLDARLITGDMTLLKELDKGVLKKLLTKKRIKNFIADKLKENTQRHERFGGTVYILEPNIKEGLGGLRDLHTARWIVQAKNKCKTCDFVELDLLTQKEFAELDLSFDSLLWTRNELHFRTKRKTEQLHFSHQEDISRQLGLKDTDRALAVEIFMQSYYQHAANVNHYSKLIISRSLDNAREPILSFSGKKPIDADFSIKNNAVSVNSEEIIRDNPVKIMKAFEYSHTTGLRLDSFTRDQILMHQHLFTDDDRSSTLAADSFLKILGDNRSFKTLEEMNNLKFLEIYIPEFAGIKFKVQHDLYHIYTVDVHTLFAIRELDRLAGIHKHNFFLQATLYEELKRPALLKLAVLFHDVGKALGKGHAITGAEMVPVILGRMGLTQEAVSLVCFLVRYHLILADTAQYRDFNDTKLLLDFARDVGSVERLNMLFLLTFADVRAVGPEVWTRWKGALFQGLYFSALKVLERGGFELSDIEELINSTKGRVKALSAHTDDKGLEEYLRLMPPRYFLSTEPESIVEHIDILNELKTNPIVFRNILHAEGEFTEIIICTHDHHGLFSMITGVMAANAINILNAQVYTLFNGIILDILQVKSSIGEPVTDEVKLKKINNDISDVISGLVRVDKLVEKRRPSILEQKSAPDVPTSVEIDNEVSDSYTVIDIRTQDRIGLLYNINRVLTDMGVYIVIAKISTKGQGAVDIFYVNDIFGQKIFYKEKLMVIVDTLYRALEEGSGSKGDQKAG